VWEELWKRFVEADPITKVISGAVGFVVLSLAGWLAARARRFLKRWLSGWWEASKRLAQARAAVEESGPGLWLAIKSNPHRNIAVDRLKNTKNLILTVANLKGGVGKTTLSANLAAYFANPFDDNTRATRNVLVIDLDFQGSCSSMLFAGTNWRPNEGQLSAASELISGAIGPTSRGVLGQPVTRVARARGISAFYDVAGVENAQMIKWLLGDEKEDIRYRLANVLLRDAVLEQYPVIIIDAPPRLTTASIQALCASTHVLIPTILDTLSADAVGFFGRQLKAHGELWPSLKVMGIVGTMTDRKREGPETRALTTAADQLRASLQGTKAKLLAVEASSTRFEFPYDCSVFERASLARAAGHGIAYVSPTAADRNETQGVFAPLGIEVERRWPL
jgi:chromosome partitioning protein